MANNLVIKLEADIARFQADMRTAGSSTQQAMVQMQRSADAVNSAVVGLAKGAVAALSIDFFAGMIKGAIDSMDALNDLRDATGSSIANISALEDVAVRTGANIDTVGTAMIKFQKVLMDAKPGSQAELGLKALGLAAEDLKNKDLSEAMLDYAKALDKFADDGNKARLILEQTGKSVRELAPFLKDLAEQEKLVGTVMAKQVEEAEKFNKELFNMRKNAQDLAREIAGPLVTAFNNFMAAQREAKKEGKFGLFTSMKDMVDREDRLKNSNYTGSWGLPVGDAGRGKVNPALVKPSLPTIADAGDLKAVAAAAASAAAAQRRLIQDGQDLANGLIAQDSGLSADFMKKWDSLALAYAHSAINLDKLTQAQAELLSQQPAMKAAAAADIKADIDGFAAMEALRKGAEEEAKRNAGNVGVIAIGLMSEVDQQAFAHGLILMELGKFHDAKFENVALANSLIEQENTRHQQVLANMQAAHDLQSLSMMGNATDQLYGILQKSGQDQTALGKAVFLASKAIAVAEILINTEVAAAKAGAQLGIFGIPMATLIRATGYASAGMVAGLAIADASAEGGYDIPSGINPVTQLHEREMVLPKQQADVIRGLAANGGSSSAPMTLTIVNQTSGRIDKVTEQRISPTERAIIIQEAANLTAAQLGDPNSRVSRSMSRNYATQRSR